MKKVNSVILVCAVLITSVFFYRIHNTNNSHAFVTDGDKNYTETAEPIAPVINQPSQLVTDNDNSLNVEPPTNVYSESALSNSNSPEEKISPLESILDSLAASEGGLSYSTAEVAFQLSDFDALIYSLASKGTSGSFDQNFRDSLQEATKFSTSVIQRSMGCNDKICAAVVDYSEQGDIDDFYKNLMESIKQPVSIVTQPVEINGVKELRILINYNNAQLVLD
ncbi:hypothetical protein ACO1PK_10910 [Alishewanella sp. d11]|uniref:hypothetical protein n=1 Tax=Alishewanella sp. d11 TaxID=3414030 RepID=UPI003BF790D4